MTASGMSLPLPFSGERRHGSPSPRGGEGRGGSPSPRGGEGRHGSPSPRGGEGRHGSPSPRGGEGRGEGSLLGPASKELLHAGRKLAVRRLRFLEVRLELDRLLVGRLKRTIDRALRA